MEKWFGPVLLGRVMRGMSRQDVVRINARSSWLSLMPLLIQRLLVLAFPFLLALGE